MVILILAVLGLILGSFVNATVWRLHEQAEFTEGKRKPKKGELEKLSITKGRSMCSNCHHPLAAKDLVPLFSWLWLRGRCRYCHAKIQDSPIVEVGLALALVLSYLAWPHNLQGGEIVMFGLWVVFLTAFAALITYDIRWYILPDKLVFPLIILALLYVLARATYFHGGFPAIVSAFWGVLLIAGTFYALFQVSGGKWIGGGDVKLGVVLGLLVGGPGNALLLLFGASLLGTLVALPLLVTGKAKRTTHLPFGPFLLTAAVIVVLWGAAIISGYEQFIVA